MNTCKQKLPPFVYSSLTGNDPHFHTSTPYCHSSIFSPTLLLNKEHTRCLTNTESTVLCIYVNQLAWYGVKIIHKNFMNNSKYISMFKGTYIGKSSLQGLH